MVVLSPKKFVMLHDHKTTRWVMIGGFGLGWRKSKHRPTTLVQKLNTLILWGPTSNSNFRLGPTETHLDNCAKALHPWTCLVWKNLGVLGMDRGFAIGRRYLPPPIGGVGHHNHLSGRPRHTEWGRGQEFGLDLFNESFFFFTPHKPCIFLSRSFKPALE